MFASLVVSYKTRYLVARYFNKQNKENNRNFRKRTKKPKLN